MDPEVRILHVDDQAAFLDLVAEFLERADDGIRVASETGFSTKEHGTGFGLHIVETIAEAHGWTVTATDGSSGGARFEITGVEVVE